MSQLIENKQNDPILIANFEPNEIATKSEEKTKIQRRKNRADEPAQKVGIAWNNQPSPASCRAVVTRLCGLAQGVHICPGCSRVGRNFSYAAAPKW